MVWPIISKDVGLKVLYEAPTEAQDIDIVAVHGLGAHPDDSWCKNAGTAEEPQWRNWLIENDMLPAIAPNARIIRYGYESQWFGQEAMQQNASAIAERLLKALKLKRKDVPFRPLVFVAHCFGGLVVLKALLEAEQYPNEWPGLFLSTTGLVFFGTPFRGTEGMDQMEMLEAARREYYDDQVQPAALEVLQLGNAYLQDLVDSFLKKTQCQANKTQIVCFFELDSSNEESIVGNRDRVRFVVSQPAGCLDLSNSTSQFPLSRTHFDMNKFQNAEEKDFQTVARVLQNIVETSPQVLWARSQFDYNASPYHIKQGGLSAPDMSKHRIDFSLQGVPVATEFVARDAEMQVLEEVLVDIPLTASRQKVVVIHGFGGIGKTQLAVEFARKHHSRFSAVFWLDGSSEASLRQSFVDIMQRLPPAELTTDGAQTLSHTAVEADVAIRKCRQWLSMPSNCYWLLIIDNVDHDYSNQDDLQAYNVKDYLPDADHGSVLITSRLAGLQRLGFGVKLGTVALAQARAILENNARRTVKDADVVLKLLYGLPLALAQAGSYMREMDVSAVTYAKYYDSIWSRLGEKQQKCFPLQQYGDRSLLTTWTMSYEQVRKQSEKAACLLKLWGFLDNGELWYELVAAEVDLTARVDIPAWLLEIAEDELSFKDAMELLSRYSLVEGKEGTESYSMHSVLHRWCGCLVEGKEWCELGRLAAELVASNVPYDSDADFWRKQKRTIAHALYVTEWIASASRSSKKEAIGSLIQPESFYNLGYLLQDRNRKQAEEMYQRALARFEKEWGPDHISTLATVNNLGILYADLGKLEQAEQMLQQALAGKEKTWGLEHTSTLDTANNLGNVYTNLGRLEQAEQMYERALAGKEKAWGPDHISTLDTVNNLSNLYTALGKVEQAEQMYERALAGYEKACGLDHTSTLKTVNNLGNLYTNIGKLEQAEQMYQRALDGKEKVWGPNHPSTLDTVNNLGLLYADLGKLEQAEHIYERALAGYERAYGLDHTYTLNTVNNLGNLYANLGKLEQAEQMLQRALAGYEKIWEPEYIEILDTANNLGNLYLALGKLEQAEQMYQRALEGKEAGYDSSNAPTTLASLAEEDEFDLRSLLNTDTKTTVSSVEDQDQLLREKNDCRVYSHAVAEIDCDCLPATEVTIKPTGNHGLAEMAEKLPSYWEEIQDQLPDSYKWDIEFITTYLEGAARNGCWTCTPLLDGEPKKIPLTIAQAPVVIPVEHRWPPVGGVNPPPDPRASSLINPWAGLPIDVIRDLFLTFQGALGFYVLISGLLQVIVPNTFETAWASSHLPHSFGGLKVCYIINTMEPTTLQSNVAIAQVTSETSHVPTVQFTHPSMHSRSAQSLQINDLIEARVSSMSRAKFGGRIGLKIAKNGQLDQPYLVMSTHVITEAILSKSFFGLSRDPMKRLQDDWNEHAEIWAGNSKIGVIEKSFDQDAEYYPSGFNHDITLIKPNKAKEDLVAGIQSPVDKLGWLSRDAWSSLRQNSAAVKILGQTGPDKSAKCIKCHTTSETIIVGEGVFLNQKAAGGRKALESHDESFWRKFVSRAVLYRVNPDFSTPNGYSGVALWADGETEDGTKGPGIVGFQSFVQRSGHTQNFNLPEGPHLEQRLRKGLVAFYGAFQVPDELRQQYRIL